jgi:hypothetical protein
MICNECKQNNLRSRVYILDSFYDLQEAQDRFFDEDGKWHVHDTNSITTKYRCTKNHEWSQVKYATCWCET